jgi:hypothetical protein
LDHSGTHAVPAHRKRKEMEMRFPPTRFGRNQRSGRLAAKATAVLAVLCAVFLIASPAMAAGSVSAINMATGDNPTCSTLGSDDGISGTLCIRLGWYQSGSQYYVTAQVNAWCTGSNSTPQCSNINVDATIANGSGYTDWTILACGHQNGNCQSDNPTWFYPFGALPITPGGCDDNVWVVVSGENEDTFITLPGSGVNVYLNGNQEDGHFSTVCLNADGIPGGYALTATYE